MISDELIFVVNKRHVFINLAFPLDLIHFRVDHHAFLRETQINALIAALVGVK